MACAGRFQLAGGNSPYALYRLDSQTGEVLALHCFQSTPNLAIIQHEWIDVTPARRNP